MHSIGACYSSEDYRRIRELYPQELSSPENIRSLVDSIGYLADWKQNYKIQSVRSSLHSEKITCIDAAILSYGLLEWYFPQVKRRLLALHRRDGLGEECGHCVTLYWGPDGRVGAFSKSSFKGLDHRAPIYKDEAAVAMSYATAYVQMNFTPLYFGVTSLEDLAYDLDWRRSTDSLNILSERLKERYEYAFSVDALAAA